ncbi:hypothetical protein AB4099_33790 [Bosea sp. 2KB_26]|uniref:hypothetical protein n=1 Tax=Bosea sp. 2KB_26 TaxID=3237475 RepID=UPI003F90F064
MPPSKSSSSSLQDHDALPADVLDAVIGGAGFAKKNEINADHAAAMTAGAETPSVETKADAAAGKGASVKLEGAEFTRHYGGSALTDSAAFGTAKSVDAKNLSAPKDRIEEINKDFRTHASEGPHTGSAGGLSASAEKSGTLTKASANETAFKDAAWETKSFASAADHQNSAAEQARGQANTEKGKLQALETAQTHAADSHASAAEKVKLAKDVEKAAKDASYKASLGVHEALKKDGFNSNSKEAETKAKTASEKDAAKFKAAETKLSEAQKAAASFTDKTDIKIAALKTELQANKSLKHSEGIPGAIQHLEAQKAEMQAKVQSAEKNVSAAKAAADKSADQYKVFQEAARAEKEHDAAARSLRSAESDEAKAKKELSAAKADHEEQAKTAADAEAKAKAREDQAEGGAKSAAEKSAQEDREQVKNLFKDQWKDLGGKLAREVGIDIAKNAAKADGSFNEKTTKTVLAGGISEAKASDGDKTVTTTRIGQVSTEGHTASYSGVAGAGAEADWRVTAEAGKITETKNADGSGQVTKTYAAAGVEAHASAHASWTGVAAQAGVTVAAHAEASHTFKSSGDTELKFYAQGDASAGAKAGATLGFDGLKLEASAKAEATASAGTTLATKIGDVATEVDAKVYATAKAEAKASAVVNFDPTKGAVGGGVKVGAVLSAGVGAEASGKLKGDGGGYAEAGVGVHVGKLGVKADIDVGFKDGAMELKVDMGAYLGVGTDIKFSCKANFADAAKNASKDIKSDNWFTKAKGILSYTPGGFLARSIFG